MADNVVITPGTGATIHADEYAHGTLGSGKTQLVKLVDGTLNSDTPVGIPDIGVKANAIRVCPANDITDGTYIGDIKFGEALPAGTNSIGKLAANTGVDIGDVDVTSVPAPLNVVGGGTEATALRVTIANNSTGLVSVDDGGGTLTVDGTVTANLSGTDNAVLDAIDTVLDTINGKVTACNTGAVVLSSGTVTTVSTVTSLSQLGGQAISMGEGVLAAGCQRVTLATDDDGVAHLATIAGAVAGSEMQVDIVSSVALDVSAATVTVDLGANNDVVAAGDIANNAIDSGNPVKVGGRAVNMDGTVPGTAVAEADRADFITDVYGRQCVETSHPCSGWAKDNQSSAQTNTALVSAPGAGLSIYITDIIISNGATAGNVKLVEDTAGTPADVFEVMYFAANGGCVAPLKTPIKLTANKDLGYTSVDCTTHSINVSYYIAP